MLNLDQYMGELVSKISQPTVTAAGNFAKSLPSYLISFIVVIMSAYFFTVQREEVIQWLKRVAPPSVEKRMSLVMDNLKYAVGGYFKAQFKIMGVVFLDPVYWSGVLNVHYSSAGCVSDRLLGLSAFFWYGYSDDSVGRV